MKTFTFRYDPGASLGIMFKDMQRALRSRKPDVREDEVVSNSIEALLESASPARMKLFYIIAQERPESVYRLAQLANRDPANVLRDARALEGIGLIRLLLEKTGERERVRPVAQYDRVVLDFGPARKSAP